MNDSPPPSLSTPSWRMAALPAAGGGLVLWLFMSRLAHAATPSANWWFGLGLALLMAGVGCVLRRSASGGRFWGGLVAPVLAGAALGFGAPNSITMGLAVLACVGGAAAVLDWAQEGPRSQVAGSVDALAAGATLLAGLVPAAAAPVIGAIAGALLGLAIGMRLARGPRHWPTIALVGLAPLALLAQGLAWPGASLAWLAGPLCMVGLLAEANRR